MAKNWQHEPFYFAPTKRMGGGWIAYKDSPSPPPAPDYVGAAAAQGAANKDAAIASAQLSNPNVNSPYGNQTVSYTNDPVTGNPIPTVNQTLNPVSQRVFDAQQQTRLGLAGLSNTGTGIAQNVLDKPFQFNGPNVQTGLDTSGVAKMPVNAGMTGQDAILSRLEPAMARQRTSLETQLTNQGLRPGTEAWDNSMRDFSQQQTDQRTQAAAQGVGLDMTANNQGYNQALQSGQFGNTAQGQMLAQALQQRSLPLNEITALMSGSQIQSPQFQGYQGSNVAPAPIMAGAQAQGQANQNMYNAQVGQQNAMTSGLFSLGGAALMAPTGTFPAMAAGLAGVGSDASIKQNIELIGRHHLGIGIYKYEYKPKYRSKWGHGHHIGVMAQEVMNVLPEAVMRHPDGYLMVNYGRL